MFTQAVLVFKDIKNNRWTIWNHDKTIHLGYADQLILENARFIVLEDKRKKILKTKKRFPHAWVIGEISNKKIYKKKRVSYNPFIDKFFNHNGKSVLKSKYAVFDTSGSVFI